MRIFHIAAILMILLPCTVVAQEEVRHKVKLNGGFKVGFHGATYNSTSFGIDGYEYNERIIQSNKIGYSVSPFIRLTRRRLYIQTEAVMSISRHYFEFKELVPDENSASGKPEYKLTTYCMQVPLLFGYNFVKSDPYGMSVFTGPKAKFVFTNYDKQKFSHFNLNQLQEDLEPIVFYWEIGLGVKISRFCFDFVYDIGLNNNARHITSQSPQKIYKSKRSDNLLSFSVGMIF